MNPSMINPHIRLATRSILPEGHHILRRAIYDYELVYLEEGAFTFVYAEMSYPCTAGDILLIRPGIPHSFLLDRGKISQPHIHFDLTARPESEQIPISFKDIPDMTETEKNWIHKDYLDLHQKSPFVTIQNKSEFLAVFYKIIEEKSAPLLKKADLLVLLSMLIEDNFPNAFKEKTPFSVAHRVKDYIDGGNGLKMALSDFEKIFFHSRFYLEKRFKAEFGIGIIEYRNKKRMENAMRLLSGHSVSCVAEMLGYPSIYSFSRAFKNHYGFAPSKCKSRLE